MTIKIKRAKKQKPLQGLFKETPEKFTKKYHDSTLDYQRLEIKLNKKYTLKLQVH